jgi:O-antigen ligase
MIFKIPACLFIVSTILFSHYTWGNIIFKLSALILIAVVIGERLWKKRSLIEVSLQHIIFLLWLMLAVFSGLIKGSGEDVFESATRVISVLVAVVTLYMAMIDKKVSLSWVSWTLFLSAIASHVLVKYGILPTPVGSSPRFAGTLKNANLFAFVSLVGISSLVYLWRVYSSYLIKLLLFFSGVMLTHQIFMSGSRKGIIGVFLILLVQYIIVIIINEKRDFIKKTTIGIIVLSLVFSVLVFMISSSEYGYRIFNIVQYLKGEKLGKGGSSIEDRAYLMEIGIENFTENPIIGKGLSSFDDTVVGVGVFTQEIGKYSHSNVIEVLVSSGAIGFIIYYSIYFTCFFKIIGLFKMNIDKNSKPVAYYAITAIIICLFYDMFAVTYFGKEFWIFFTCILSSITLLIREEMERKNENEKEIINRLFSEFKRS